MKKFVVHRVLPALNRAIRPGRVKLVPHNTPNRSFPEFFAHLRTLGMTFRTVVDVGVAHGTPGLHDEHDGARFYLVDPVPYLRDSLAALAAKLGGEAFNVAAGSTDGEMSFFVHSDTSGSSSYRQLEGALLDGEEVKVPVRRLDSIIPADAARPLLLKIDTQGAELEVIGGAERLLQGADVVIVEASFHEMREGAPEFADIVAAMRARGFLPYELLEGNYRAVDNALAQVDIAFVPEGSPLRAQKAAFSPEQAAAYARRYDAKRG